MSCVSYSPVPAPSPPRQQLNKAYTQTAEVHEHTQSQPLLHTPYSLTPPYPPMKDRNQLGGVGGGKGEKVMDRKAETDDSLKSPLPL